LINYVVITLLLTGGVIAGTRGYFSIAVKNVYDKDKVIANMQSMVYKLPRKVYKTAEAAVKPLDLSIPTLQRIKESGVLRVGYHSSNMPFTYFSGTGELIGFDVDMAQLLARELKVKLEFIPFDYEDMAAQLEAGLFDVIMSGIVPTTPRLAAMTFSEPYMEPTLCFIVRDHRRKEFATRKAIKRIPQLKIGVPHDTDYFLPKLKSYLPRAEIIPLKSVEEFFEPNEHQLDALFLDAEGGSAWTLMYPKYKVVVPVPDVAKIPLAYPVIHHDLEFADFLSRWINLKKHSREFPVLYDHWILGLDAVPKKPRWSIIRNVLGWVK
jgi:ABC-type amino acid transport substrate-binding protein